MRSKVVKVFFKIEDRLEEIIIDRLNSQGKILKKANIKWYNKINHLQAIIIYKDLYLL